MNTVVFMNFNLYDKFKLKLNQYTVRVYTDIQYNQIIRPLPTVPDRTGLLDYIVLLYWCTKPARKKRNPMEIP